MIETDLECARCGYNLRTQPDTGFCPECRVPVSFSRLPEGFAFESASAIRSVRRGLVLFIAAILVAAIARAEFTLYLRLGLSYSASLRRRWGPPSANGWVWGNLISHVLIAIAICSIVKLMTRGQSRGRRIFGGIAMIIAFAGALPWAEHIAYRIARLTAPWADPHDAASLAVAVSVSILVSFPPLLVGIAIVWIRRRVNGLIRPRLRRMLGFAALAQLVIFAGSLAFELAVHLGDAVWSFNAYPLWFKGSPPDDSDRWQWWRQLSRQISEIADFWEHHVGDACRIIIVLAAWSMLRALPRYKRSQRPQPAHRVLP